MSLRKELRDQSAHIAVGIIGVLPVALWPHPLAFLWATFIMGLMRDLGAWTLAGLLAWAIAAAVTHTNGSA